MEIEASAKNILLTGRPGCGKTTLIEGVVSRIERPAVGFITREVREEGFRVGFSVRTLDGKEGILAHVSAGSLRRVGKYGVLVETVDQLAVPSLMTASSGTIVVIDEIGKMECLSSLFRKTVLEVLDSPNTVLATIAEKGDFFMRGVKSRKDVCVITVTPSNRDALVSSLVTRLNQDDQRVGPLKIQ